MTGRTLPLAVGLALFGVALLEMVVPGIVPVPIGDTAIPVTGGLILLYAYYVARSSEGTTLGGAETPEPERRPPTPAPGDDFDDALKQFLSTRAVYSSTRTRRGLRAAAIAVLTRYDDCTATEAARRIDEGTWTSNRRAAAFLAESHGSSRSLPARLGDRLRGVSHEYERGIRNTVSAIASIAEVSTTEWDDADRDVMRRAVDRFETEDVAADETSRTTIEPTRSTCRPIETNGSGAETDAGSEGAAPETPTLLGVRRPTHHWSGVSLVALVAIGAGLLAERPGVLLAGVVGVGYAAYARSLPVDGVRVSVDRSVAETDPDPGEEVEVSVTITNESDRLLPDLRVVDGVPEGLTVADGSPRCGTALRAGESTTFSYAVTARRGRHEFQPTLVLARTLSGTIEQELFVTTPGAMTCVPPLRPTREPVPLRQQATQYTGTVETSAGGEGVEFYGTRQYQPGDPMNRIDWHHHARTGDLATLEFRQERAATVVLVIDVQPSAYVSPASDGEHAVDRSVAAARRVFARLLDDGHRVGIATMGAPDLWLPPSAGRDHRARGRTLLATDPALSSVPDSDDEFTLRWQRRLRRRLPDAAQLLVFSPLCQRSTVRSVRQFDAEGHATTVVSPDPTADGTPGQRLARVHRTVAATDLRGAGIPVFDWGPEESIDEVLARGRYG